MTLSRLRIAQISDIHVGPTEEPVQGLDVRGNFLKTLEAVREKAIDFVVISGDIAADKAEEGAYAWVSSVLKNYPIPWVIMGGNHDKISTMARYFDISGDIRNGMLYFQRVIKGYPLFFLDTSTDTLHQEQMSWLESEAKKTDEEIFVFMHHPPAICGCLFMDTKYPLKNIEEVRRSFKKIHNLRNIFVGHYHTEKFIVQDGKNIHLTPSTMMQIDTRTPHFRMEHTRPGWRIIELYDGRVDTEVHYLIESPEPIVGPSIF